MPKAHAVSADEPGVCKSSLDVDRKEPLPAACAESPAAKSADALTTGQIGPPAPNSRPARTAKKKRPPQKPPYPAFSDWRLRPRAPPQPYTAQEFKKHWQVVRWDMALVGVGLAIYGTKQWGWGSSSFKFKDEGWFGKNTASGGMDKLGHAFSAYVLADALNAHMSNELGPSDNAALTASLLSFGTMALVEVFDGLAKNHGFSVQDLAMDAAGAAFSYLRNTVPGLRDKLDYRLQYMSSGGSFKDPLGDYMGQKYLFALKLSGFENLRQGPLRFVELHAGYFARGYGENDAQMGIQRQRHLYAGIGLNLNELLFSNPAVRGTIPGGIASTILEYVQVPYTSVTTNNMR